MLVLIAQHSDSILWTFQIDYCKFITIEILHDYWLNSPHYILHTYDSFILQLPYFSSFGSKRNFKGKQQQEDCSYSVENAALFPQA